MRTISQVDDELALLRAELDDGLHIDRELRLIQADDLLEERLALMADRDDKARIWTAA